MRKKINFLSSLFSRRDWFETRFVGNPEDRFSRVVACVACSTALGQILQVQQIIMLKQIWWGGCSSDILKGVTLFDGALHRLIHKSFVTTAHRAGERRGLWFSGYRSLVWPCTNSAFARLVHGYKWLGAHNFFRLYAPVICDHPPPPPPPAQRNVVEFDFVSTVPHSNHHIVGGGGGGGGSELAKPWQFSSAVCFYTARHCLSRSTKPLLFLHIVETT